jgi:predicted CXXCH cytochrome family protein
MGNQACTPCHAEIYRSYSNTGMARSSGSAKTELPRENTDRAQFSHGDAQYSVRSDAKSLVLTIQEGDAKASRQLDYFIGSGHTGRSYASDVDGFLFESPVSYYSSDREWRISPGYQRSQQVQLLRPVETACLNCHASRLQPAAGTLNGYAAIPFLQAGVGCERCHGPGERHVAWMRAGVRDRGSGIVNPVKLDAARRDSVCQQCHLSGEVRISRNTGAFRPGDLFSERTATFVLKAPASALQVNSHVERLALSACARVSGSRFWCGTCHDPHFTPPQAAVAGYYRQRCLVCHQSKPCTAPAARRTLAGDNCIVCHMPRAPVRDVEHTVYTDHAIPRIPGNAGETAVPARTELAVFGGVKATDRETGLAWATIALHDNDREIGNRAFEKLKEAYAGNQRDPLVATQLAQIYDRMGRNNEACELYRRAAETEPAPVTARINLATCEADHGDLTHAIEHWREALLRAPGEESARLNLAVALFRAGDGREAVRVLQEALKLDPVSHRARELLSAMDKQ